MLAMLAMLGAGFGPVGLLILMAFADARDGAALDDLRNCLETRRPRFAPRRALIVRGAPPRAEPAPRARGGAAWPARPRRRW